MGGADGGVAGSIASANSSASVAQDIVKMLRRISAQHCPRKKQTGYKTCTLNADIFQKAVFLEAPVEARDTSITAERLEREEACKDADT